MPDNIKGISERKQSSKSIEIEQIFMDEEWPEDAGTSQPRQETLLWKFFSTDSILGLSTVDPGFLPSTVFDIKYSLPQFTDLKINAIRILHLHHFLSYFN